MGFTHGRVPARRKTAPPVPAPTGHAQAPSGAGSPTPLADKIAHTPPARAGTPIAAGSQILEQATGPGLGIVEKDDDILAREIFNIEMTILSNYDDALDIFEKVISSEADSASRVNFNKVMQKFFYEKVLGELAKRSKIPGAGEAIALLSKFEDEAERAAKAGESASLRDFYDHHKEQLISLRKNLPKLGADFEQKVRNAGQQAGMSDKARDEYGMMRLQLVELAGDAERRNAEVTPAAVFRSLSEEWINQSTVRSQYGVPAYVVIRVWDNFSVRDAKIIGPGSEKIAEQMKKYSPDGVDVYGLRVPRRVLVFHHGDSWPFAIVLLDSAGNLVNAGSYAEGDFDWAYRQLSIRGLERTKEVEGVGSAY
jgi:hypothetical protein